MPGVGPYPDTDQRLSHRSKRPRVGWKPCLPLRCGDLTNVGLIWVGLRRNCVFVGIVGQGLISELLAVAHHLQSGLLLLLLFGHRAWMAIGAQAGCRFTPWATASDQGGDEPPFNLLPAAASLLPANRERLRGQWVTSFALQRPGVSLYSSSEKYRTWRFSRSNEAVSDLRGRHCRLSSACATKPARWQAT
jgi:hypothetical protein